MSKWALVGSAPASVRIAPYSDLSWKIIGCSPGVYGVAPRVDEWMELHLWEPGQAWFSPEYVQWLTALPKRGVTLWVGGPCVEDAQVFPFDEVLAKHDPKRWFCSSSLFWMMARAMEAIEDEAREQKRAINPEQDKIAFYGVDMAAGEEYEMQRAGIHFLAYKAAAMGIEVGAPMESDLFTPRFRYGADEWTHSFRKVRARRMELEARAAQAVAAEQQARDSKFFLQGAIDDLKYMGETWVDKGPHTGLMPAQPLVLASVDGRLQDIGAARPGTIVMVDNLP